MPMTTALVLVHAAASAFHLRGAASFHAASAFHLPASHLRAQPCFMSAESDLAQAEATLVGLVQDGYGPEVLEPLQAKILQLRKRVSRELLLPPMSAAQRAIWTVCDRIDDESDAEDSDTTARLGVLRGERKFLLDRLLGEDVSQYCKMLDILSARGLNDDDYPARLGKPMASAEAVEEGLSAEASPAPVAREVSDAAAAAAAEAANEASMATQAPTEVDMTFVRCFVASEEALFKLKSKVVGKEMWSQETERARLNSFRAFLTKLIFDEADVSAALTALAIADDLRQRFEREKRDSSIVHSKASDARVAQRAQLAWLERADFVEAWSDRTPTSCEPLKPNYEGLSAVGRIRAQRKYERELSGERPEDSAEAAAAKANKWFADWAAKKNLM